MHILLIDRNPSLIEAWNKLFTGTKNVTVLQGDLTQVSCDAIVSPANSFGFMDGGVDYAISERLGWHIQETLQAAIRQLPEGELLVGRALVVPTEDEIIPYLISAPSMRVPMSFNIATSINAYLAMKAALVAAQDHSRIEYIAIPGFCTGVGRMKPEIAARQMHQAFTEIIHGEKMDFRDWSDAQKHHRRLNPEGMIFG